MRDWLALLFCASAFGADIGESQRPNAGLVGRWLVPGTFSASRAQDTLGRTPLLTTNSPTVRTVSGVVALDVRGAERGAFSDSFAATVSALAVWFEPAANVTSSTASYVLVGVGLGSNSDSYFGVGANTGFLTGETITVVEGNSNRRTGVIGVNLAANRRHHLVFSWDSALSRYQIYLNGAEQVVQASAAGHAPRLVSSICYLGSQKSSLRFSFEGWLGETRIYNRSLAAEEVAALYKEGLR